MLRVPRNVPQGGAAISFRRILTLSILAALGIGAIFFVQRQPLRSAPEESNQQAARAVDAIRRSVVLVTVDTTRPDRLGPYGAQDVATPVMDRLASRGIVFERAWSVAPITLVAHTSILSGKYPFEHGVRNNGTQYVSDSVTTLAERLQEDGYRTGAFVSAAVLESRYGLDQGFEVYDDDLSDRRNLSPRMVADRAAAATVESAKAWLDSLGEGERFFLWVHFYDPHANYSPPPPFRDDYRDRLYDGEIAYMDQQLGQLLQHDRLLGAEGTSQKDAPVVMMVGDHGESLGEHGERTHAILAYDSTLHVPWILHIPGGPAGLRVSEPVGHVDLMPTTLALLGLKPEEGLPGRDLLPLIEGRERQGNRPYYSETYLPFYTYGWAKLRVLHQGKWKMIDAPTPELYDRSRDPLELTDLHTIHTDVAHDMGRDLGEWLSRYDADQEASLPLDSEALAQLRSLGYLSVGSGRQGNDVDRPNPMEMIAQHVGLERARSLLADQLFPQAQRQLESVLRRDPQNLAALIDLTRALEGQDKIEEAISIGDRALSLDPEYTQTYMILARLEAQRDDFERALELTKLAIDLDPKSPEIRVQQASFYHRMGRFEKTRDVLAATLAEYPDNPRANTFFAQWVEMRQGKLPEAETRLRTVVQQDPFLSQAWFAFGRVLEMQGNVEEAEASYRRGLQRRPDDADLHSAMGNLLARLGRKEEAVGQLREAIRLSANERTELRVSLGAVLAEMGRSEEAQREYDRVLALDPSHPGARNNAAIALYRSGHADEARAALEAIVRDFPRQVDAHNNLAAIAVDQKRWQDGVKHSRKTLELAPQLVEAWNNLGIALEELGQQQEALEAYQKALAIDREYWQAYFNRGFLLQKIGRPTEAAQAFEEVLVRVPNHAETHLELGTLYAGPLADPARARAHWNAFLRHSPGDPRQADIRKKLATL